MAVIRCVVVPFRSPPPRLPLYSIDRRFSLKFIWCSSVSPPFPSRPSKRRNYLRPKILKTLRPKPWETTLIPVESPETVPQIDSVEELQVSDSLAVAEEHSGVIGKFSPESVAKYGLYLLGVFTFQTVCAVWFLGNSSNSRITLESIDAGRSSKRSILSNRNEKHFNEKNGPKASNVIYLDDLEMNQKIAEIQAMAREARKTEQKGCENEYDEEEISHGNSNLSGRVDIEGEIGARLANMEKRLNSQRKGLAGLRMESMDEFKNDSEEGKRGDLDMEGNNKSLMFEKKYKFKAEKPPRNVKGFPGRKDSGGNNESSSVMKTDKKKHRLNGSANHLLSAGKKSEEMQKEEIRQRSDEVNKSRKSGCFGEQDSNIVVENSEAASESGSICSSTYTSNSRHGEGKQTRKVGDKRSDLEDASWWLKLPYVLRILMRSAIDNEISEGFFTLRTNSMEPNTDESSYAIAFEDQIDARNFCYLLESFFEDLSGFSTKVVPTSTKDFYEEVSLGGKNAIVVKKRQLKLYAGQPFEDVERALHSLIRK